MQKLAFSIGRKIGKHPLASKVFCLAEPMLPLDRLGRSAHCVAFAHPRPMYDPHILVVPTRPFPSLATLRLSNEAKAATLWEMVTLGRQVTSGPEVDWQMIVNGGQRQEIGQVHGHMIHVANGAVPNERFDLASPSTDMAPWIGLFERLTIAAERPNNGYSVIFHLPDRIPLTASITESDPA